MAEIERKFRLFEAPIQPPAGQGEPVLQGYLLSPVPEVRLRRKGARCYLTVKSDGSIVRDEWESEIPAWVFDSCWPQTEGRRIEKTRYSIPHEGWVLEVDVYGGLLAGLVILECEFTSLELAFQFQLPAWARSAVEVTDRPEYKNRLLAMRTGPPPLGTSGSGISHSGASGS